MSDLDLSTIYIVAHTVQHVVRVPRGLDDFDAEQLARKASVDLLGLDLLQNGSDAVTSTTRRAEERDRIGEDDITEDLADDEEEA